MNESHLLKSKCWQHWLLLDAAGEDPFIPCLAQPLETAHILWPSSSFCLVKYVSDLRSASLPPYLPSTISSPFLWYQPFFLPRIFTVAHQDHSEHCPHFSILEPNCIFY